MYTSANRSDMENIHVHQLTEVTWKKYPCTHQLTEVTWKIPMYTSANRSDMKIPMYTSANRSDMENTHVHIS